MLYATHKDLKVELESLFNFPLGPTEFEKAWCDRVEKYGIKEHLAIKSLWNKKETWIMAYFKGVYCGQMTSTQLSESTNRVLKDGYVNHLTSLHQFAEKMLETLQHMNHIEARESHHSQVRTGHQLITIIVLHCYNDVFGWLLCRPLLFNIVVRHLMISWPGFTPWKSILSTGKPSIKVQYFKLMKILVYIMGTSWGINGPVEVFVGQTMLLEYMLMSKMVNLSVNVDNESIQVGLRGINIRLF
jgi:hypothetical protein